VCVRCAGRIGHDVNKLLEDPPFVFNEISQHPDIHPLVMGIHDVDPRAGVYSGNYRVLGAGPLAEARF